MKMDDLRTCDNTRLSESAGKDLDLSSIIDFMTIDKSNPITLNWLNQFLTKDPEVICTRQAFIKDLIKDDRLLELFKRLMFAVDQWINTPAKKSLDSSIESIVDNITMLDEYRNLMIELNKMLDSDVVENSVLLNDLSKEIKNAVKSENFSSLNQWLDINAKAFHNPGSLRIGINMNGIFEVESAAILSIDDDKFMNSYFNTNKKNMLMKVKGLDVAIEGKDYDLSVPQVMLTDLIRNFVQKQFTSFYDDIIKWIKEQTSWIIKYSNKIKFFTSAAYTYKKISSMCLPVCFPVIRSENCKSYSLTDFYSLSLVQKMLNNKIIPSKNIVMNNIKSEEDGEIFIITGSNHGGKTTLIQAIGIIQYMSQLGLPVPASKAEISLTDGIYTIFNQDEGETNLYGRLGDEIKSITDLLDSVTPNSLVLLNETFTTTSPSDGVYLSHRLLGLLLVLKLRVLWVTHYYELADNLEELDKTKYAGRIKSLIAVDDESSGSSFNSYRFCIGKPQYNSHAEDFVKKIV